MPVSRRRRAAEVESVSFSRGLGGWGWEMERKVLKSVVTAECRWE